MPRIALIGPDGCGKSRVARALAESPSARYVYMGVNVESSNILLPTSWLRRAVKRLRREPPDDNGPRDPHEAATSSRNPIRRMLSFIKGGLRTANLIAEELFRLLVIRTYLLRKLLVIQDRDFYIDYYEYDCVSDGQRRSLFRRVHGWFLTHLYRKPDLVILLDVSPQTMLARKQEGTIEALQRRREHYHSFTSLLPEFVVVNAEADVDDVVQQCRRRIGEFMDQRHAKRIPSGRSQNGPPAVVIGIDCITGLQTARLLARRGVRVVGLATRPDHFCCRTNSCERILASPASGPELIETLNRLANESPDPPVLYPCTDPSVLTLAESRDELSQRLRLMLPEAEIVEMLLDKARFARYAAAHDLPIPPTYVLESEADVDHALTTLAFPLVLKPNVKTRQWEENTQRKAIRVETPEQLREAYRLHSGWCSLLIAQEYVPGDVDNCFTVNVYFTSDHQPVAAFSSRKLRQWPLGDGTACLAEEFYDERLIEAAVDLFRPLDYTGLAYIEFKRHAKTGQLLIIEPNIGRPTGRSAMAEAAGVELLYSLYCDAVGRPLPIGRQPRHSGRRKWIHWRRDLQAAIRLWRRGELSILDWMNSLHGSRMDAVFDLRDPGPTWGELRRYVGGLLIPAGRRRRSSPPPRETRHDAPRHRHVASQQHCIHER